VIVRFDSPDFEGVYETEVPCLASPFTFAYDLIERAHKAEPDRAKNTLDEDLRWATADGSPLL
jgi:hypothetical protein